MKLGYARVSSRDQSLDHQVDALKHAGCLKLFQEKVSGRAQVHRPELERMLEQLREGDIVVVWELTRLARSTRELLAIIDRIEKIGAAFTSLSEPWADTTSPAGKLIMTVFAGVSEFERDLTRDRCAAGRTFAKKRGVKFGRKRSLDPDKAELARVMLLQGRTFLQVARSLGVSKSTMWRFWNEEGRFELPNMAPPPEGPHLLKEEMDSATPPHEKDAA